MRWTVIRGNSLKKTPWRNGRGTSRSIATRLARDGTLLWQVSIADLLEDAPFSHYAHHDRIFTPVAGEPAVELSIGGAPFTPCPLLIPVSFGGELETLCRVHGAGRALNVIVDRRHCSAQVDVRRLEAGDAIEAPDAPEVVVHCVRGELGAAGELLAAEDSLLGPGPASPGAAAVDDTAVILVAIRPSTT
jgi:environmental stress-induced protein Ves